MAAGGEIVCQLDADDLYDPRRLAALVPIAAAHGAVVNKVAVVSDTNGQLLYTAPDTAPAGSSSASVLSTAALLDLAVPLFPVLCRRFAIPRLAGVEYAEDLVANMRLIEQLGPLPVFPCALYQYRVVPGSLCHDENSGPRFEAAYSAYLARLDSGDGFGLVRTRAAAQQGLARKRELNRLFIKVQHRQPSLTFQHFMARCCGSVSRALETFGRPGLPIAAVAIMSAGPRGDQSRP